MILGVIVAWILLFLAWRLYSNAYKPGLAGIPGPTLARFTDLWRMNQVRLGRHATMLREVHEKYGKYVRLGPNLVSISDPAVIDRIVGVKVDFLKGDHILPNQLVIKGKGMPNLLAVVDKNEHAAMRRPIANVYSVTALGKLESGVDDMMRLFTKRLDEEFVRTKKPCDIHHWAEYFAYDVICQLTMSRPVGFLEKGSDFDGIFKELDTAYHYRGLLWVNPLLDYVFRRNPIMARLPDPASDPFMARAKRILDERLNEKVPEDFSGKDMVSKFVEIQAARPDAYSEDDIMHWIAGNLIAGSDTVSTALKSMIYYVLKNPAVQARLEQELADAKVEYPLSYQKAQQLPYVDAIIREGFRIHFVSSLLFERIVPAEGLHLPNGKTIPPGTIVGMNGWTMHFNKDVYGSDAAVFNPDRWLQRKGESADMYKARLSAMKATDMTFSKGNRSCLGKNIAYLEIYKALPTLFGLFKIRLANPEKDWSVAERFFTKQSNINILLDWKEGMKDQILSATSEKL